MHIHSRFTGRLISQLIFALSLFPSLTRAVIVNPLPDCIEVTESSVIRWNMASSGHLYASFTGTSLFGDCTLSDGRVVAYRTTYGGQTPALYQINPADGSVSLLVQSTSGAGEVVALAPMRNGNLLACDNSLGFLSINPSTLAYSVMGLTPSQPVNSMHTGGMATSPTGEIFAWISGFSPTFRVYSKLAKIDTDAHTVQFIGGYENLPASQSFDAMAFAPDGRLFGFTTINGGINGGPFQPNGIYQLDLQTGLPTLLSQRQDLADVRGVVFLPEPAAPLSLLAAASALPFFIRTLRRRKTCRS